MLQLCLLDSGRTGKVLVWPVDFSHWINSTSYSHRAYLRGHEITVLVPYKIFDWSHNTFYHVEILQVSVTKETFIEELSTMLYEEIFELPKLSWWEMQIKLANLVRQFLLTNKRVCDSAITNKELLSRLQAAKFDVCIADPLLFVGNWCLNIPFIFTFRFSMGMSLKDCVLGFLCLLHMFLVSHQDWQTRWLLYRGWRTGYCIQWVTWHIHIMYFLGMGWILQGFR